ncbi:helix-turn-helix domain-containing protein [Megasphaera sp.]|uniref:helix-turn-helix domain-containing protein n=1 Tax=Megasphaera sp. TaxID=2023260 RepID=UPI003522DD9D
MVVNKAYRYRIYPTREQKIMFAKTFGCVRFIYNKMLSDRLDYYKKTGQQLKNTPAQYKNIRIDTITKDKDGKPVIQRVRVVE